MAKGAALLAAHLHPTLRVKPFKFRDILPVGVNLAYRNRVDGKLEDEAHNLMIHSAYSSVDSNKGVAFKNVDGTQFSIHQGDTELFEGELFGMKEVIEGFKEKEIVSAKMKLSVNVDRSGMVKIGEFVEQLVSALATAAARPAYVKASSIPGGSGGRAGSGPHMAVPSIGIRPSYADEGPGVLLDGVSEGRAAAKAGILGGDRIVEILGKPCNNMETYMTLMGGVKRGDSVEFTILRAGQKLKVKIETEK